MEITLKDIDDLKTHVGEAVVKDVKAQLDPILGDLKAALAKVPILEADVDRLKKNQAKALVGFTVLCAGVTLLFNQVKSWVFTKVHLN